MARSKVAGKPTESGTGLVAAWRTLQVCAIGMALIELVEAIYVIRLGDVANGAMNGALVVFFGLTAWGTFQRARWSAWTGGLLAAMMGFFTLVIMVSGPVQVESAVTYTPTFERVLQPIVVLLCGAFLTGLVLLRRAQK
jgi:hypothetical protein